MTNTEFNTYKLSSELLKAIDLLGFKVPTQVQSQVIPVALEQKDVIVKSQTGSGKTAAFAIPICDLIEWEENKPQVMVLTPTRELALQVKEDFFNIGRFKRTKVVALYGKSPFHIQLKELKQKTHVVVGTPGRVLDHLERGTLVTEKIQYLVIDEADEMLNMGFIEQLEKIIKYLPKERVTMLFSATMPQHIKSLCEQYMEEPIQIEIAAKTLTADRIEQVGYEISSKEKIDLLHELMVVENPDSCIIFGNTKQQVDEVFENLRKRGYSCQRLHGGMEQDERLQVMKDFKRGYFRYLVATDVAARGIDIEHITHVVNYDVPQDTENYVHRIGRTGRASRSGKSFTLIAPQEKRAVEAIEGYIGKTIPLGQRPSEEEVRDAQIKFEEKMSERSLIKEEKGEQLTKEILKIHINAGKKTKMRPVDIVGTLCSLEGMTAADIGIINVLDVSTFVEILNNKGKMVLEALQHTPIKGRLRKVSRAEQ